MEFIEERERWGGREREREIKRKRKGERERERERERETEREREKGGGGGGTGESGVDEPKKKNETSAQLIKKHKNLNHYNESLFNVYVYYVFRR